MPSDRSTLAIGLDRAEVLIGLFSLGEDPAYLMEQIELTGFDDAISLASDRTGFMHGRTYQHRYNQMLYESIGV